MFSDELLITRRLNEMSVKEAAKMFGVNVRTYKNWEAGTQIPNLHNRDKVREFIYQEKEWESPCW